MNRRRVRTVSIISAGLLAASMFGGVAGAEDPPAAATGTVSCRLVGRMTFTTPLAAGGTAATTANFKGLAVGCTGTDGGAVVKRGVITASVDLAANDCAALVTPGAITLAGSVRWKTVAAAAPIADTTVSLGGFTADPASLLKPLYAGTGSASAGSFSGQSIASTLSVSQSIAAITNQCAGARLRGFTVRASLSTIAIGTPAPV
ncbi:MAG: hypothetical protein RL531_1823 [Actinomycetota bacterium]|jgi:hypothetical protein